MHITPYTSHVTHSFIDIHCHILPGIDDGPRTMAGSIDMCRVALSDGIRTIVASPHVLSPLHASPEPDRINDALKRLREVADCDLEIVPGADVHADPEVLDRLEISRDGLTINGGRYMLLEFSVFSTPTVMSGFIDRLLNEAVIPIVTHPERNPAIQENPGLLFDLVRQGALVQVTAMSITGGFGERAKSTAFVLMKYNLAHIIASDAHDSRKRPPVISEAVALAAETIGEKRARSMVMDYPRAVIENVKIENLPPPTMPKKKRRRIFKTHKQMLAGIRKDVDRNGSGCNVVHGFSRGENATAKAVGYNL